MLRKALPILLLLLCLSRVAVGQCPLQLQEPCSCSSNRYEAVSIVCDKGDSLNSVLIALTHPPKTIDSLVISNTPIEQLPGYAFQGFNIKKLVFRNNGLRNLHPNTFSGALETSLEELEIRGNYLEAIPQTGIPNLQSLKILSLTDNLIEYVQDNAFMTYQSRQRLEQLDLSSNNMTAIHPTGLLGLENLIQLSLNKNLFVEIPTEALDSVVNLEDLSLGINQIMTVPRNSLPLPNLKSLSLEVNQIRYIAGDSFETTPQLKYLYLGNNLLTSIDPTMFLNINQLKLLSMVSNKDLTTIPANFLQNIPELNRLELSDCSITNIESGAFRSAENLQVLILSRNQITQIAHDTFSNLVSLQHIELWNNAINRVDDFAFSQLPSLTYLDLSSNRLETLPDNMIYDSFITTTPTKTRKLLLQNNPWRCDKDLAWLRKWLRDNGDVQISADGGLSAKCWTPAHLNGLDLRQTDPTGPAKTKKITEQVKQILKPAETLLIPTRPDLTTKTEAHSNINGLGLVGLVLGIVLSVLALCLVLLMIIRCILKQYENRMTEEQAGNHNGGSSASSAYLGSSYSATGILNNKPQQAQRSATNSNIYLNRPRYWWL